MAKKCEGETFFQLIYGVKGWGEILNIDLRMVAGVRICVRASGGLTKG